MATKTHTVLITGGSSGIGLDAARAFHERGSNVVLNGRDSDRLAKAAASFGDDSRVAVVRGDAGDREVGQRLVKTAVDRFGSADVLVNSAGLFEPKPFLEYTEEDLDRYLSANIKAAFFTSQAAIAQMKQQGGGSIVNIGTVLVNHSIAGLTATGPLVGKGALHALTVTLASEFAADKIRVNTVAPGVIRTPLYGSADVDSYSSLALLDRVGEVKDTTEAVVYLATADFVTGTVLNVDGGYVSGRP